MYICRWFKYKAMVAKYGNKRSGNPPLAYDKAIPSHFSFETCLFALARAKPGDRVTSSDPMLTKNKVLACQGAKPENTPDN